MDEMQATTRRLQDEVYSVHKDSARISSLQEEQTTLVRSFADTLHRDVSWVHACVCVCVCVQGSEERTQQQCSDQVQLCDSCEKTAATKTMCNLLFNVVFILCCYCCCCFNWTEPRVPKKVFRFYS